jgi:O-antigen/teichoic acid export membrane protein
MRELSVHALWEALRGKVVGRQFVQNVGLLTAANGVGAILSFAQAIVVARWLGPESYGVVALVMSYPNLLFSVLDAKSAQASVKYLGEFSARNESERAVAMCKLGYAMDMGIALLSFLLVIATAWWAEERIVHTPGVAWLMILFAASFLPRSLASTSRAVLTTLGRFSLLACVESLSVVLRVTLVLTLVLVGYGVAGVVLGSAIGLAVQGITLAVLGCRDIRQSWGTSTFSGSWSALKGRFREILRFVLYTDLNALVGVVVKQLDLVCLGYFIGPTEAGYYRLAKSIAGIVHGLVRPLETVAYPRLASLWGTKRFSEMRRAVQRYAVGLGIPICILVLASLLLLPTLIRLAVGNEYLPATILSQMLLVGGAIAVALFWVRPLYLATGRVRFWFFLGLLNSSFAIVAYPVGAVLLGAKGVAAGRVAAAVLRYGPATVQVLRGKIL